MSDCNFCARRIFVLNKLEEFSQLACLHEAKSVLSQDLSGIYLIGYSAWGLPRQDSISSCRCLSSVHDPLKDLTDRRSAELGYAMHTLSSRG